MEHPRLKLALTKDAGIAAELFVPHNPLEVHCMYQLLRNMLLSIYVLLEILCHHGSLHFCGVELCGWRTHRLVRGFCSKNRIF